MGCGKAGSARPQPSPTWVPESPVSRASSGDPAWPPPTLPCCQVTLSDPVFPFALRPRRPWRSARPSEAICTFTSQASGLLLSAGDQAWRSRALKVVLCKSAPVGPPPLSVEQLSPLPGPPNGPLDFQAPEKRSWFDLSSRRGWELGVGVCLYFLCFHRTGG